MHFKKNYIFKIPMSLLDLSKQLSTTGRGLLLLLFVMTLPCFALLDNTIGACKIFEFVLGSETITYLIIALREQTAKI